MGEWKGNEMGEDGVCVSIPYNTLLIFLVFVSSPGLFFQFLFFPSWILLPRSHLCLFRLFSFSRSALFVSLFLPWSTSPFYFPCFFLFIVSFFSPSPFPLSYFPFSLPCSRSLIYLLLLPLFYFPPLLSFSFPFPYTPFPVSFPR